ncbi:MAG: ribosomal protein S18-alanine N-acetyltransferase [Bdellovibrionota bacterium]
MIELRSLTSKDLPRVRWIESHAYQDPWPLESFDDLIRYHHFFHVGVTEDKVLMGYVFYQMAAQEMQILNIAVDPNHHSKGFGSLLLEYAHNEGKKNNVIESFLEVRVGNQNAQKLYRKFGYKKVGRRIHYYQDNGEDAWVMRCKLP